MPYYSRGILGNLEVSQNFRKSVSSWCKIRRETRWIRLWARTTYPSRVIPNFRAKIVPRARKNEVAWILRTDLNLATSKTPITAVSSKSNEFINWSKIISLQVSKIFSKVPHPDVKFDGKHDGDVSGPVRTTVPELSSNFVQKLGSRKMYSSKFWGRIWIWRPQKPPHLLPHKKRTNL